MQSDPVSWKVDQRYFTFIVLRTSTNIPNCGISKILYSLFDICKVPLYHSKISGNGQQLIFASNTLTIRIEFMVHVESINRHLKLN